MPTVGFVCARVFWSPCLGAWSGGGSRFELCVGTSYPDVAHAPVEAHALHVRTANSLTENSFMAAACAASPASPSTPTSLRFGTSPSTRRRRAAASRRSSPRSGTRRARTSSTQAGRAAVPRPALYAAIFTPLRQKRSASRGCTQSPMTKVWFMNLVCNLQEPRCAGTTTVRGTVCRLNIATYYRD